jgi:rod shape-determining protein MreD
MKWWLFMVLAVGALTLQGALAPRLDIGPVRPDWLLVCVIFFALHGRRRDAVIAAWLLGFCADLMTLERTGLLSISYAAVAILVSSVREYLFRHEALTQLVVTFITAVVLQVSWLIYRRVLYPPAYSLWFDLLSALILAPLYTAIWAPVAHRVLLAMAPWLGIPRPRYSFAGSRQWEGTRV